MPALRYERVSPEFARVANLSDAVFAIAMTLLVLTLDTPAVPEMRLAAAIAEQVPQALTFALAFGLVASIWWQHHKLFAALAVLEPGLIAVNLVLLGAVAFVPYPTSLVGAAPAARAAVLPFIAMFALLSLLYLAMVLRAQRTGAWQEPLSTVELYRTVGQWLMGFLVLVASGVLAWWFPLAGLSILAVSVVLGPLATRLAPVG